MLLMNKGVHQTQRVGKLKSQVVRVDVHSLSVDKKFL